MINSDAVVEAMIKDKGLTAPRVLPGHIDAMVASLGFKVMVFDGTTTTVAAAFLPNGFEVAVGKSACASPENFNAEIGAKIAVDNARDLARQELWKLEGYLLKVQLANAVNKSVPGPEPTFLDRLQLERSQLAEKHSKLSAFFATEIFGALPVEDQDLLGDQISIMEEYLTVLTKRITRLTK